jgi:hypothetical protein
VTPPYTYEVVTSNGAGIHSTHGKLAEAKTALAKHAARYRGHGISATFEIQRVRHLGSSRQYDVRRRSRWVPWSHEKGPDVREPDFCETTGASS